MASGKRRILISEDEKPLSHALALKLEHEGFEVTAVYDGQACVDTLDKESFDIVLLDLIMPVMDGFQVLAHLKEAGTTPVVFVLSNLSQTTDEERVLSLGARKFFVKSDTPLSKIVEEVKKILG